MSKKNTTRGKMFGKIIVTEQQSSARIPGNKQSNDDKKPLDVVITGGTAEIIDALIGNKNSVKSAISGDIVCALTNDNGICGHIKTLHDDVNSLQTVLKDRFASLLGVLYGLPNVSAETPLATYKGKMGAIDITRTPFNTLNKTLLSILAAVQGNPINTTNGTNNKQGVTNASNNKSTQNVIAGSDLNNINLLISMINDINDVDHIEDVIDAIINIIGDDKDKDHKSIRGIVNRFNDLPEIKGKTKQKIADLKNLIVDIVAIGDSIKLFNIVSGFIKLTQLQGNIIVLNNIVSNIPAIWNAITKANPNKSVNTAIANIIKTLDMLANVDTKKLSVISALGKSIVAMNVVLSAVWVTTGMGIKGLSRLVNDKNSEIRLLNKLITGLSNIDTSPIEDNKKLNNIIKTITLLGVMNVALTAIVFTGVTAIAGLWLVHAEILLLKKVCDNFKDIDVDNIDTKKMKDIAVLIGFCSGIMIIAGYTGKLVLKNFVYIMAFSIALGTFMVAVIGGINLATRGTKDAQKNIAEFGSLIGICGIVMIFGGMIMMTAPELIQGSFQFAIALGAFIALVGLACTLGTRWMKAAGEQINAFEKLILISCATMLIGALFVQVPGLVANALLFGLCLGEFILIVTAAYVVPQIFIKNAMKHAKEFSMLLVVSASVMIFGAMFMQVSGLWYNALLFGLVLGGFIFLVTLAYTKGTKGIRNALPNLAAFFVIVLTSSVILFAGGSIIQNNPWLAVAVTGYIVLLVGFIFGFSYALKQMRKRLKISDIIKGLITAGAVTVLIVALTYALNTINNVKLNWGHMFSVLGQMGIVITAVTGLCTGLGLLMTTGVGTLVLASGAAAVLAIAGILVAMVGALHTVDSVNGKTFDVAKPMIKSFCDIIPAFEPLVSLKLAAKLVVINAAVKNLANCISMISTAVQSAANLAIVTFDKNGKISGFRYLQESDFENAANNVKKIVSILGSAIIEIYDQNPEIFSTGSTLSDLLGMNTRFSRVCKSCATLGQMISKISEGVKDYASLRIPTYDNNGKVIGSRAMTETDFNNAAKNVGLVITTLGKAVIDVYNMEGAKEMFEWHLFGDNKFVRVVKSTSKLGKLISDIAAAIRGYANLRVNVYDNNGKVVGNRAMTPADFILAGINVSTILTTLGAAIIKTYNNNPMMFAGWGAEGTPMYKVVKGMQGAGRLIMDGASGIQAVMALNVNDSEAERQKIADKVAFCVGVLADSLLQCAYVDYDPKTKTGTMINPAFEDKSFWHNDPQRTPVGMVKQALTGTKKLIDEGINVINGIMKLNIPDEQLIKGRAKLCVAVLAEAIHDLAINPATGKVNPAFDDDSFWHTDASKTPFGLVKKALEGVSTLITKGATTVNDVLKLNIDADKCGGIVQKIFESLPNAILNSTLYHGENDDDEIRKFWRDDPVDKIKDIKTTLTDMITVVCDVVDAYAKFVNSRLITNNDNLTDKINVSLKAILTVMTSAFVSVQSSILDVSIMKGIVNSFNEYKKAISTIVTIYTTTYNNLAKAKSINNTSVITTICTGLQEITKSIVRSVQYFDGVQNIQEQMTSFTTTVSQYAKVTGNMISVLNSIPDDYGKKTENLKNAIRSVNELVTETPYYREILRFDAEVKAVEKYVNTVNSINGSKIDKLTNLSNALTTMSTKLGSLEGLTDVLANKVAVVLAHLSDQMAKSANVIKTAENIQNKRHAKITDAMKQLKQMMNVPLNVSVVHRQDNNSIGGGGSLGDTPQNTTVGSSINKLNENVNNSIDNLSGSVSTVTDNIMKKVKQYIDSRDALKKKGGKK